MEIFEGREWRWFQLHLFEKEAAGDMIPPAYSETYQKWLQQLKPDNRNSIRMEVINSNHAAVYGSLVYHQGLDKEENYQVFHFYLTKEFFLTVDLQPSLIEKINLTKTKHQMLTVDNGLHAFFVVVGMLMSEHLEGIDQFEEKLREQIWKVYHDNDSKILEEVNRKRHELLVYKSLILTLIEIEMAVREAFLMKDGITGEHYRTYQRIERGFKLVKEYEEEVDNLIHSEEVISTYRGNEIMKALTIFTAIFTPMTALGALWGMNFKHMPELDWKLGYLFSLSLIFISTFIIYFNLRKRGWTGDILKKKKKNTFFKE
ncbi:magnesium transporter CorA family protein [Metabacillus arenae]|uniref:Magnesium transporter CorA family protein n=1 Tax=Metabacillus arenae TaxID=2771434 RepID=A0A926RX54_9BACI|nr:magnesium transporter CorA family protein [Metabacillus arenae]MBD1381498.1 magnesium transporter CorA family protein [Metabacillus arenae]